MPAIMLVNDDGTQDAMRGVEGIPILPQAAGARQQDSQTGADHVTIAGE